MTKSKHAWVRRTQRVIRMVSELHKLGYQRLRVMPFEYPLAFRVAVGPVTSFAVKNGAFVPAEAHDLVIQYSSSSENRYFGWEDAKNDTARELAAKFLERLPEIAGAGKGSDWTYAGWLLSLLGEMERTPNSLPCVSWENGPDPLTLETLPMRRYGESARSAGQFSMPPPGEHRTTTFKHALKQLRELVSDSGNGSFAQLAGDVGPVIAGGIMLQTNPDDEDAHMPAVLQVLSNLDHGLRLLRSGPWSSADSLRLELRQRFSVDDYYPADWIDQAPLGGFIQMALESISYFVRDYLDAIEARQIDLDWEIDGLPKFVAIHAFVTSVFIGGAESAYGDRPLSAVV